MYNPKVKQYVYFIKWNHCFVCNNMSFVVIESDLTVVLGMTALL